MTIQAPAPTKTGSATKTRQARASVAAPELPTLPKTAPKTAPKTDGPERRTPTRTRSAAAQRAYARRAQRSGQRVEAVKNVDRNAGRASFVVLVMTLLTVGVVATLWLSTQAIADSYRLEEAKKEATQLSERAAQLQREVTKEESASSLAKRAKDMGMVPAGDTARIVVQPDGSVVVVGDPKPAQAAPPPAQTPQQNQPQTQTQNQAENEQDGQQGSPPPGGG